MLLLLVAVVVVFGLFLVLVLDGLGLWMLGLELVDDDKEEDG